MKLIKIVATAAAAAVLGSLGAAPASAVTVVPDVLARVADPALRTCIQEELNDSAIPSQQFLVEWIYSLDCDSRGVKTVAGLEVFPRLTYLNLQNNFKTTGSRISPLWRKCRR
ncbi:hypothetical protein O159_01340 [Leifsonia xyli subsp. cynodontis DSM 46306]|uniref:Secreted protein n=1 Tax=Leifsonia xyli subsp. cynodontis DSM 46306 TaxID=1389489 RepID=U3P282_LEIXC|nr:hypothetical protein [Leifsonia xyli]AGW40400.1 hypothetical protein O159_01340 [Leifsonia xyli subsp. cynodontis DSM 46306]